MCYQRTALKMLDDELPRFIRWIEFRPDSPSAAARPHGLSVRIGGRGGRAATLDEVLKNSPQL